jgi:Family of unknown function (DUF6364)
MRTKLTLRIDEGLIARAKAYSRASGKSVSQIVADYLALLPNRPGEGGARVTPTVRSLRGLLRGAKLDEADYRRHLEDRYL